MKWIKKLFFKPKPDSLERFKHKPLNLTLEEWQSNPQLVAAMEPIARLPVWRALLEMMRNSSPAEFSLDTLKTLPEDRAALQSKIEGYHMALNNLESASIFTVPEQAMPEAKFEPEEE